jgi:translation initiation factor 2 alpha subunit (eIF-2alpha)
MEAKRRELAREATEKLAKKLIEKFGNIYEALESKRTLTKEEARLLEELDETVKILVRN